MIYIYILQVYLLLTYRLSQTYPTRYHKIKNLQLCGCQLARGWLKTTTGISKIWLDFQSTHNSKIYTGTHNLKIIYVSSSCQYTPPFKHLVTGWHTPLYRTINFKFSQRITSCPLILQQRQLQTLLLFQHTTYSKEYAVPISSKNLAVSSSFPDRTSLSSSSNPLIFCTGSTYFRSCFSSVRNPLFLL